MNKKRISVVVLSAAAAVALYALLGFLLLPYVVKSHLVDHVEQNLGHRLTLGALRFNPFTLRFEFDDIDLRESDGGPMFACRRLAVDVELASLWRRAFGFAAIEAEAPHLHFELRPGGSHNFSALAAALRDPNPQPDQSLPPLAIERIVIADGRIDLADRPAGESARLTLAPIAFELTELTTEASDTAPYKLTARSADGERIQWHGEVSLNPAASNGRLELQGWKAQTLARWLGNRIALSRADGTLDVALDYRGSYARGSTALVLSNLDVRLASLALVGRDASEPFVALDQLRLSGGSLDLAARKFAVERIELASAALRLETGPDGRGNWMAIVPAQPPASATPEQPTASAAPAQPPASAAPAPATEPTTTSAAPEPAAAASATAPAPSWSGRLGQLVVADSSLTYADRARADTAVALSGMRLEFGAEVSSADGATELTATNPKVAIAKVEARADQQQLAASDAAWNAVAVSVKTAGTGIDVAARAPTLALASIAFRQGNGEWQVGKLGLALESVRSASSAETAARIEANALAIDASAISGRAGNEGRNAIEAAAASVRVQRILLEPTATNARVEGTSGSLKALLLRDPASGTELARLAQADIAGATLALAERRLSVDTVTLAEAHATGALGSDGKSNWDALLAAFGVTSAGAQPKPDSAPWSATVRAIELRSFGATLSDQRQSPPLGIELQQVNVRARDASTDRKDPLRLELSGRIKDGGSFNAAGRIDLNTAASDLKVKLEGVSLLPLQSIAARYARVQIVSALASADGRLRYNMPKAAGADLVFEGDIGLDKVIVEETEPAQPLLSVQTLRAAQAKLTLGPDRLEIPDLRLNSLNTRLLIAEDQSVNIVKLLRPGAQTQPAAAKPRGEQPGAKPPAEPSDADDTFPIVLSRVRLDNSVLEFSDLSLRPQFNTRMHELQGVITGISTAATTRARMELEARVDEFGSAQIQGSMNLFKPRVFTDVTMVFRNLEMTDLTPYAAKFAGYRIASGKLSMDLHYRIRNSALLGENKIVLDKLELGEKVESPTALNLPLELAIAILKDENGRIDIGLPVSGSLEDPQFSIAGLVWRAIGSLLGRIITAPFRALGRLFGGGAESENLDSIEFRAGVARIAAPERQKLQTVAEALAKRPDLTLTVKPAFAPQSDRNALQSLAIRRAVLARAGIKLEPGEAPGPLDYGNARIRRAIEDEFTDAFGFPAARDLRAELAKTARKPAAEVPPPATSREPASDGGKPPAKAPELGEIRVVRTMAQRLMEARIVSDADLTALAQQRGEAIAVALRDSAKIDATRLATAPPRAVEGDPERGVATSLELGVAK